MPDRSSYNTRLRTNSVLLPPRRLRRSPSPPTRSARPSKPSHNHITAPPPLFPPPDIVLHPDDAANKTLTAIGRAMLAVDNRAITIKDLSQLSLDCGLLCQNVSAASQAITTFIRNHLNRCNQQRTKPLLLSLALTGTLVDDRLAPALHSRSGGTSCSKDQDSRILTSFRRGTTVWYLSEMAGAPCPFKRAGLCVDEIFGGASHGAKRKREPNSPRAQPRKLPAPGPAMATRTRTQAVAAAPAVGAAVAATNCAPPARLRVKLTLRVPEPDLASDSDTSDSLSPISTDSPPPSPTDSLPLSPAASSTHSPPPALPPYPILSPSIPSPHCTTPSTSLASPSAYPHPCTTFFPTPSALSNPPRFRSVSLPFSTASPPPDSEDEDHDFHNSMVGMRRGSVPLPTKKEEEEEEEWSAPLEILPGFEPSSVKQEPMSAVLPPSAEEEEEEEEEEGVRWEWADAPWHARAHVKREREDDERTVLDPEEEVPGKQDVGVGTRDDPVCVGVDDVELLGPESVRCREWDGVWVKEENGTEEEEMDVDVDGEADTPNTSPTPTPTSTDSFSPTATATSPASSSSPSSDTLAPLPSAPAPSPLPFMHPLLWLTAPRHESCIRAEDVFLPRTSSIPGAPVDDEVVSIAVSTSSTAVIFDAQAHPPADIPFDEQEDALFSSFVDFQGVDVGVSIGGGVKVVTTSAPAKENIEKENANSGSTAGPGGRRRKEVVLPVRRSKRVAVVGVGTAGKDAVGVKLTRARSRAEGARTHV